MTFASWQNAIWLFGFLCHLGLFSVLVIKRHWHRYPTFVTLIGYEIARSIVLFVTSQYLSEVASGRTYLSLEFGDYVLQAALVLEMARAVLCPNGRWIHQTRSLFFAWSAGGATLAAALCMAAYSPSHSPGALWEARADLFTTIFTSELFLSLLLVATRLRLLWSSRVMALGGGLGAWCVASLAGDAVDVLTASKGIRTTTDALRMVVYLGAVLFWTKSFYVPKRDEATSPAEFEAFVLALEHQLGVASSV